MYFKPDYQDYDIIGEKDYELNRNFLENQRNLISSHVYQITELLSEVFGNYWEMFMRKVRCYSYQVLSFVTKSYLPENMDLTMDEATTTTDEV